MAGSSSSSTTSLLSSSSSSTAPILPPNLSLLISNLSSFITVKLDSSNFLIWKNQFQNILRATYLIGYVDGSTSCPSPTIKDSAGKDLMNPEFLMWNTIDAHLLSVITATLSPSIYTSVVHLTHCSEIWSLLEKRFTSLSRSHIHQMKNRLNNLKKGSNTMDEFLRQIQEIAEQLSLASAPIDDEDLVLITLNGLPDEFDAFKTTIRARSDSIMMQELCSLLCSEAIHVEAKAKKSVSSDLHVAFASVKGDSQSPPFARGYSSNSSNFRGRSSFRGNFRGRGFQAQHNGFCGPYRGRYGARSYSSQTSSFGSGIVTCQICHKFGHTAVDCWYRMDNAYSSGSTSGPRAYAATQNFSSGSSPWYVDSAATHHITNDLNNLQIYQPYTGVDQVTVGNGSGLPIHHSGKGILPTPSFPFHLNNVLHVPSISSNLLSVQQLAKDNNCTITFDDCSFVVQDKLTNQILHRGLNNQGLYQFASSSSVSPPHAFVTKTVDSSMLHQCLGHPSTIKF